MPVAADAPPGTVEFVTNSSDLVAVIAELHAALAPGDLAQTLSQVTDAAVELLPDVDGATITVEHAEGRFETAAATGSVDAAPEPVGGVGAAAPQLAAETAARLDHLQQVLDEGPAVDVADSSGSTRAFRAAPRIPGALGGGTPDPRGKRVREPIEALPTTRWREPTPAVSMSLAKRPRSGRPTWPATIAIPPTASSR